MPTAVRLAGDDRARQLMKRGQESLADLPRASLLLRAAHAAASTPPVRLAAQWDLVNVLNQARCHRHALRELQSILLREAELSPPGRARVRALYALTLVHARRYRDARQALAETRAELAALEAASEGADLSATQSRVKEGYALLAAMEGQYADAARSFEELAEAEPRYRLYASMSLALAAIAAQAIPPTPGTHSAAALLGRAQDLLDRADRVGQAPPPNLNRLVRLFLDMIRARELLLSGMEPAARDLVRTVVASLRSIPLSDPDSQFEAGYMLIRCGELLEDEPEITRRGRELLIKAAEKVGAEHQDWMQNDFMARFRWRSEFRRVAETDPGVTREWDAMLRMIQEEEQGASVPGFRSAMVRIAVLVATLLGFATLSSAASYFVSGTVRYENGSPAANARVELRTSSGSKVSVNADASGNYAIVMVDPGAQGDSNLQAFLGDCVSEIFFPPPSSGPPPTLIDPILNCD